MKTRNLGKIASLVILVCCTMLPQQKYLDRFEPFPFDYRYEWVPEFEFLPPGIDPGRNSWDCTNKWEYRCDPSFMYLNASA